MAEFSREYRKIIKNMEEHSQINSAYNYKAEQNNYKVDKFLYLQSRTARKLQSEAKKQKKRQVLKGGTKNYKVGQALQNYKVGHNIWS